MRLFYGRKDGCWYDMGNNGWLGDWVGEYAQGTNADIHELTAELKRMLIKNISSSTGIPAGILNVVINNVTAQIHSPASSSVGFASDGVTRPSIYNNIAKKGKFTGQGGDSVDLAMLADAGRQFKKDAVYHGPYKGNNVTIYLARSSKFGNFPAGNFLDKTAKEFMALHPNCTVVVG